MPTLNFPKLCLKFNFRAKKMFACESKPSVDVLGNKGDGISAVT